MMQAPSAESPTRILVVEDVDDLREQVLEFLNRPGWVTRGAHDAQAMDRCLQEEGADIIVLDLGLPGEDGLSIARRLRAALPQLGLVMMTGRASSADRVLGYQSGADIYLPKPVHPLELEAALLSLERRLVKPPSVGLVLQVSRRQLVAPSGPLLDLTPLECQLMLDLCMAPQTRLGADELARKLSAQRDLPMTRGHLAVVVSRLRERLGTVPEMADLLMAGRGQGYALTQKVQVLA